MELRDYQERVISRARELTMQGRRAVCIVAPTGAGKTVIGSAIAQGAIARGRRVLWLAHRSELIDQAVTSLQRAGIARVSVVRADDVREDLGASLTVASPQTLLARGGRPQADLVVLDECHHYVAEEWNQIPEAYVSAIRIGLTATPERSDGVALGNLFDSMVVAAQPRELIHAGHLSPVRVVGPHGRLQGLAEDPVKAYLRLAPNRKAIVFASTVEHAKRLAEGFKSNGITARCVDGAMDEDARRDALRAFRWGTVKVLTNVFVLTEGFDDPSCDCAILARGFTSPGAYIQAVGRAMRTSPGKTDALIIDLKGASSEHGLPDEDRVYSLEGSAIKSASGLDPITQCAACGMVFRAAEFHDSKCPGCGHVRRGRPDPRIQRAALDAITATHTANQRASYLQRMLHEARARGYKQGWALMRFKIKYKRWPSENERALAHG